MNRSSFGGSPYTPRGSPYTPRGRGSSGGSGGGFRGRAARFSPLVNQSPSPGGRLPDFTPSPRGGRGGWGSPRGGGWGTPRGRGFGGPRGRGGHGGDGGLCFDDTFVRFATENPWAELERQKGLSPALGPLNSGSGGGGGGSRLQSVPQNNSPAASPAQSQQQGLPVADDDGFV